MSESTPPKPVASSLGAGNEPAEAVPLAGSLLGIEAAAETQIYFAGLSADIAAHLGISPRFVHICHEANPLYWQEMERRYMSEAFGPLAPRHLLEAQARADRKALRDRRRAARRLAWLKGESPADPTDYIFTDYIFSADASQGARWKRCLLAVCRTLRAPVLALRAPGLVLIALYYAVTWLAHHYH